MAWIYLIIAGALEVVRAYFMKQSHGFTRLWPSVVTFVTMFASFGLLSVSMKTLPLGTAYAMWTGIGAVGAFLVYLIKNFLDKPKVVITTATNEQADKLKENLQE